LTGINPYEGAGSIMQVMYGHCQGPVLDPRETNANLPPVCSAIVARATAKRPEDRYQSAQEMLADLGSSFGRLRIGRSGILVLSPRSVVR
jgi:hypothetical protein